MNKIRTRVVSHAAILQFQGDLPDFTRADTGNEEIDRLPFDVETVARGPAAALD